MCKQSGFGLIQLVVASLVTTLIAIWGAQALVNQVNDASAQSAAQWMLAIQRSAGHYLLAYGKEIKNAQNKQDLTGLGFQDWSSPSLAELQAAGFLSNSISTANKLVGTAKILVTRQGNCNQDKCNIDALIIADKAILNAGGNIDLPMITQWLLNSNGRGAVVYPENINKITGQLFEYDNPVTAGDMLPIGTVVLGLTQNNLPTDAFLTIKDDRDPQFQNDLSALGNINAGGNANVDGNVNIGANAKVDGDIFVDGNINIGSNLYFSANSQWLSACSVPNAVTRDSYYGLLICLGGGWQTVGRSPGAYSLNSKYGCANNVGVPTHNPVTGNCSCPAGYMSVQISEGSTGITGDGITYGFVCVL